MSHALPDKMSQQSSFLALPTLPHKRLDNDSHMKMRLGREKEDLVGEGLVVLEAMRFVTDQQVA